MWNEWDISIEDILEKLKGDDTSIKVFLKYDKTIKVEVNKLARTKIISELNQESSFIKLPDYKFENKESFLILNGVFSKNENSSSLICWYRGTWKTTLIQEVIRKRKDSDSDIRIIDIFINTWDIEVNNNEINKDLLLRKFIRRLYFGTKDLWKSIWFSNARKLEKLFYLTFNDKFEINWKIKITNNLIFFKEILYFSSSFLIILFSIITWFFIDSLVKYFFWQPVLIDKNLFLNTFNNLKIYEIIWIIIFSYISYILFKTIINISFSSSTYRNINDSEIREYEIFDFLQKINEVIFLSKAKQYFSILSGFLVKIKDKKFLKKSFYFPQRKLVIVFDEMDKFFDKINNSMKSEEDKITFLFNIIWTLKYMFFSEKNNIHFVFVFGKEVFDYFRININTDDDIFSNIFSNIIYHDISKIWDLDIQNNLNYSDLKKEIPFSKIKEYLYINHYCNLRQLNNKINNYYPFAKEKIISDKYEYNYEVFYKMIYCFIEWLEIDLLLYKKYLVSSSNFTNKDFIYKLAKIDDKKIVSINSLLHRDASYRDYMVNKLLKVKNYIIDQKWWYVEINDLLKYFKNWEHWLDDLYNDWYNDFEILLYIYLLSVYIKNQTGLNINYTVEIDRNIFIFSKNKLTSTQ